MVKLRQLADGRFCPAVLLLLLAGCATQPEAPVVGEEEPPVRASSAPEPNRVNQLERQLAEKRRQCAEDRRKYEAALRESQKRADEIQKKLDALISLDRQMRQTRER